MQIKCEYCGSMIEETADKCPLLHSLQAQVDADTQIGFLQVLDLNLRP